MSDLLPLLVAVSVRDKVLTDAKEELEKLHKRVDVATSIEVVHDAVDGHGKILVYASEKFEKGTYDEIFEKREYDCEIFWKVSFNHPRVCKLFDLEYCHICVGGGFSIFEFCSDFSFDFGLYPKISAKPTRYRCWLPCLLFIIKPIELHLSMTQARMLLL